jgi:hypothetical protein
MGKLVKQKSYTFCIEYDFCLLDNGQKCPLCDTRHGEKRFKKRD